jgi:hypothetical protein
MGHIVDIIGAGVCEFVVSGFQRWPCFTADAGSLVRMAHSATFEHFESITLCIKCSKDLAQAKHSVHVV